MENNLQTSDFIKSKIFTLRGVQVMLDSDLAVLYGVETKVLNQAVKRNLSRFPESFMFKISEDEYNLILRSHFVTSSEHGGRRYLPFAFTEQGISMLSAILKSQTAITISIQVINAFVEMRKFIQNNAGLFQRIEKIEQKQIETDGKIEQVFKAIESQSVIPKQGIFFDGQIFDAYVFASDLIAFANKSIMLIDNYIDNSVLTLLSKRKEGVSAKVFTKSISKQLDLDVKKHNEQYKPIEITTFAKSHDRFLIIDEKELYHIGASLKDLGKKWFAFSKMEIDAIEILEKIK